MRTNGFVGPLPASLNLVESFTEWTWANNCFHDHVVAFALRHQDALLAAPPGEHSHAVHSLHTEFAEGLESFVEGFLSHHGATMEQFSAALTEHHDSADLATRCTLEVVTEEVFALMDYHQFLGVMLGALILMVIIRLRLTINTHNINQNQKNLNEAN